MNKKNKARDVSYIVAQWGARLFSPHNDRFSVSYYKANPLLSHLLALQKIGERNLIHKNKERLD